MEKMGLQNTIERQLWHGTGEDSTLFINQNGFDKSYFGAHGNIEKKFL